MKQELRIKYRNIRKNIKYKKIKDFIIFLKLITNKNIRKSKIILTYVSTNEEVNTVLLIKYFLKRKLIAVPRVENNIINFYEIKSLKDLEKGKYNILEPLTKNKITNFNDAVCITPGICFSKDKYRIGYGKGFYDKFFSYNKVYSIGLCYKKCLIDSIPIDKYQKQVDEIIYF